MLKEIKVNKKKFIVEVSVNPEGIYPIGYKPIPSASETIEINKKISDWAKHYLKNNII
jgi:hypothetical protein